MSFELIPIEFEVAEDGHCCDLCNPLHFADYETRCVPVRAPGGNRAYYCLPCVRALARAARGTSGTNHEDLQRWRGRVAKAEQRRYGLPKRLTRRS